MLLYFTLSLIIVFLGRLLTAFITIKLNRKKDVSFSDIFDYKAELINAFVLALFFVLVGEFFKYYNFSTLINYLIVLFFLSLLLIYQFLALPISALIQKEKYIRATELEEMLKNEGFNYHVRIVKGGLKNALAAGFFPYTKIILIGEFLYKNLTTEELKAIVYHEIGHLKLNHIQRLYFISLLCVSSTIFINMLRTKITVEYNLMDTIWEVVLVALSGALYGCIYVLFCYIFQRRMEYQADSFAVRKVGAALYVKTLEKLNEITENKMMKGSPTHPPLKKRIKNAYDTK